jgi:hypothetical protein
VGCHQQYGLWHWHQQRAGGIIIIGAGAGAHATAIIGALARRFLAIVRLGRGSGAQRVAETAATDRT